MGPLKSCCCWSLKTGTIVIGLFTMLLVPWTVCAALYGESIPGHPDRPTMITTTAFLAIVRFVSGLLLIYGADRSRKGYLLPWMIATYVIHTVELIGVVSKFADPQKVRNNSGMEPAVAFGLSMTIFIFFFYFWLVVVSLYRQLKEEQKMAAGHVLYKA